MNLTIGCLDTEGHRETEGHRGTAIISFHMMSYKDYLLECINLHYQKIIDKYHFSLVESYEDGNGAYSTYSNNIFLIKIINDRGLVNAEVAPQFAKNQFVDIDIILRMIRLNETAASNLNSFERKLITNRKYSCEEHAAVIEKYYDSISLLLSREHFDRFVKGVQ